MARTPLFDVLRRTAALAAAARRRGMPLDEVLAQAKEARTDAARRRFLARGAAASAAVLLGACAPVVREAPRREDDAVVVVGAGIAGLACAYRLRLAGVPVRVFEARERIGGRMLSLRGHFAEGQVCELGGELIDSGHTRMHGLAAELGLVLDDLESDPTAAYGDVWFCGGRRYAESELLAEFAPLLDRVRTDAARIPDEVPVTYRQRAGLEDLDRLPLSDYLDQIGCRGWLRTLIDVAYTTEMGLECTEQSALNFLDFIGTDAERFRIFGESDERYHVRGGNDLIVQRLAERVADAVSTGCALEALRQRGDGAYVLSLRCGAASREVVARRVVLAVPFTTLRRVRLDLDLPPAKRAAIARLRYGTNAKLMLGVSERLWATQHRSSGSSYSDLPLQTTWETSRCQDGKAGILTNFVGGRHGLAIGEDTPARQAERAARELEAIYPGMVEARAGQREARMHWPSQEWTLGSYACFGPGDWTGLRGAMGEPVGGLYFAGEHCAFDNQGFMEGGAETGEAVAQILLGASMKAA